MPKMTEQQIIDRINEWMSSPNSPPSISAKTVDVVSRLLLMPPDARIATLHACGDFFCRDCGNDIALGDRCHCNNDE